MNECGIRELFFAHCGSFLKCDLVFPLMLLLLVHGLYTFKCFLLHVYVQDGLSALMLASHYGHITSAQLLVEKGADKDAKNKVRQYKMVRFSIDTCVEEKVV